MQGVEELHSFNNLCTGYKATENTFNNHHLLKGLLEVRWTSRYNRSHAFLSSRGMAKAFVHVRCFIMDLFYGSYS